uniref:Uncharacterized protein LOC112835996 n=1 Tax=Callorhinus ursinus TaxID=34884 RepID=A0A3Q7RS24_CALUR|nr:uncharacterized protein LOC112835996 [Callorhinus ursinus]
MAVSGPRQHVTRARSALARPAAGRSQHRAGAAGPRPGCRNPPGTLSERQTRFLLLQSPKSGPAGSRPETASGDAGTRGERSRRVRRRPTPCGARPVTPRAPGPYCRLPAHRPPKRRAPAPVPDARWLGIPRPPHPPLPPCPVAPSALLHATTPISPKAEQDKSQWVTRFLQTHKKRLPRD